MNTIKDRTLHLLMLVVFILGFLRPAWCLPLARQQRCVRGA
jgi:hypothetical protein